VSELFCCCDDRFLVFFGIVLHNENAIAGKLKSIKGKVTRKENKMEYVIETKNLTKKYGSSIVADNVNMHVPKGKIYGLLGRNGAGKTTVMKMMLQLIRPTTGTVDLFGKNYKEDKKEIYSQIGSMIETPGFYDNLTAYENLMLLSMLHGKNMEENIRNVLEVVNLHKEMNKTFAHYSLGMKQRLGIAAAMLHNPNLLILDEPTNGLDPIGISKVCELLSDLSKNKGITILISSHMLNEIKQIADVVGILHEGKLMKETNMENIQDLDAYFIELIGGGSIA